MHPATEACDDFNTLSNGCSSDCEVESFCYQDKYDKSVCLCGDGAWDDSDLLADEECDDNNFYDFDGCSSDCKIETNFEC